MHKYLIYTLKYIYIYYRYIQVNTSYMSSRVNKKARGVIFDVVVLTSIWMYMYQDRTAASEYRSACSPFREITLIQRGSFHT